MEPASPDLPLRLYEPRPQVRLHETDVPRSCVPCIDAHNHLGRWLSRDWMTSDVGALVSLMDACNVATVVNLDGRWGDELEANLDRYDRAHPGRFLTFCHLDWTVLTTGQTPAALDAQLADAARRGARGLKVWKDLGLAVRDVRGNLVLPDDPRLSDAFAAAGALGLPVLMHTADPVAFFAPVDRYNERLEELAAHPDWWFGGDSMPALSRLLDAFEAVVAAHPGTTFIGAHAGNCAEDLAWVTRLLDTYPNLAIDIAARLGELGRQPRATRRLIVGHPDRVLFGTDCFPPSAADYALHFRFLESDDEHFDYAPGARVPPQGRWRISAIDLPRDVLEQVYAGNARRLLRITE
jgi:hypothetical protein